MTKKDKHKKKKLESRFNQYVDFLDYSKSEFIQIFMSNVNKFEYIIDDDTLEQIKKLVYEKVEFKDKQFGNVCFIRNTFENILSNQANSLAKDSTPLTENFRQIKLADCLL